MSIFNQRFTTILAGFAIVATIVSSLVGVNIVQKIANATLVQACTASESLEGTSCTFVKTSTPKYETKCAVGYTLMDATCSKFSLQGCSAFAQAVDAESGFCKLDFSIPTNTVYLTEINDFDGRQCDGLGTNFKRYNVNQEQNSPLGAIICGNNFSALDKAGFRFLPRVILEIKNLESIKTEDIFASCPAGYTELATNKCSRPSVAQRCNAGGEIFVNNICAPCPAGKYCPVDGVVARTMTVCANGGVLSGATCIAPIKYPVTHYTDGCTAEYTRYDQSCAIVQVRNRDTGCSYFYTSENVNITATQGTDGYCSTGGRSDFATASITRVSDFNCNGAGTYYYNYNVAFDPLVCGNDYLAVGKTGFKWLPTTFTKITALQKLPSISNICPVGWNVFDTSNNCSQNPITQEYKDPVNCPINTYCPGGNPAPIPCPAGTTSPAMSTKISDCVPTICTNGTINYPICNQCPVGLQFVNNTCLAICPIGVSRDANNNCTICNNGAVNPSSGCNACAAGYIFNGANCVPTIVCNNGFVKENNVCVCLLPKVVKNSVCQIPVVPGNLATISGYSYIDTNNNGIFETNESAIPGVNVTLIGVGDGCKSTNLSTTTDASGFYKFSNLIACKYSVIQTQPTAYNNGITTAGTINGIKAGTVTVANRIDEILLVSDNNSINNNFGELLIPAVVAPVATNTGTVINITNNPVNNNTNNNTVSTPTPVIYQAPVVIQPIPAPIITPLMAPIAAPVYYSSPVVNVTETIRSGGINVMMILSIIIAAAGFGLVLIKGKRNSGFKNHTFKNS